MRAGWQRSQPRVCVLRASKPSSSCQKIYIHAPSMGKFPAADPAPCRSVDIYASRLWIRDTQSPTLFVPGWRRGAAETDSVAALHTETRSCNIFFFAGPTPVFPPVRLGKESLQMDHAPGDSSSLLRSFQAFIVDIYLTQTLRPFLCPV